MGNSAMTGMSPQQIKRVLRLLMKANEVRDREVPAGKLRLRAENAREALELYEQAVKEVGETSELLVAMANCYSLIASYALIDQKLVASDEYSKMITCMEKAVLLDPENGRLHAYLAEDYEFYINEYTKAAKEIRKALDLNPNDVWALSVGARLYGYPEKVVALDEAIAWLERAVSLDPNDPNFHVRLAHLYRASGRNQDAFAEWGRALLCPRPFERQILVGELKQIESLLAVEGY